MSGIYIPCWEDPMFCNACPFNYDGVCFLNDDITCTYAPATRAADCPLIPVPDHGRLIDADALITKDNDDYNIALSAAVRFQTKSIITQLHEQMQKVIAEAPTIIPADKEAKR